jgi:hypothetical protein
MLLGSARNVVAEPAPAAPPPVAAGRIQGLGVHEAAQFLSRLYHVPIIVVGGVAGNVVIALDGLDATAAIERLAKAAGLRLARKDAIYVLAPREIIATATAGRRGLPPGARVDLDFLDTDAMTVFGLLAKLLKLGVDGTVRGHVSVLGYGYGALDLVGILSRMSGREASRHAGRLLVSGAVPESPEPHPHLLCAPDFAHMSFLQCAEVKELVAEAWGRFGDRAQISLRPRSPGAQALMVRIGDAVGKEVTPVKDIDARGALLSDGTIIAFTAKPEGAATP